ncbi:MAG: hypothetical protein LBK59_06480 [Bifidobacteriaceae bacterium]|jgi:hypothetical protein|nr:hypothetical protein [Bifidobacteriaceae bacterium]
MVARKCVRAVSACVLAVGLASPSAAAVAQAPYPPVLSDTCTTDISAEGTVAVVVGNFCSSNTGSGGNISVTMPVDLPGSGTTPAKAGRYPVKFTMDGQDYTRTYTVGKAVSITSVKAARTSKGVRVTGKTTKNSKVRVQIKRGRKVISTRTVATSKSTGRFSYLKTLPKGKYTVTVTYVANTKYFGDKAITKTFTKTN